MFSSQSLLIGLKKISINRELLAIDHPLLNVGQMSDKKEGDRNKKEALQIAYNAESLKEISEFRKLRMLFNAAEEIEDKRCEDYWKDAS